MADDRLRIEGKEYTLKQHGFARDTELVECGSSYLLAEQGRENYPYAYELAASYAIDGNTLICNWQVKNFGDQIGAHPAFLLSDYNANVAVHGYLQCYNADGKIVLPITNTMLIGGLRQGTEKQVVCDKNVLISITNLTFIDGAILLDGCNITSIALLDI